MTDENISTGQAQAANKNNKNEKKLTSFIRKNLIHEKNKGGWKYASILLGTTSVMTKFSLFFCFLFYHGSSIITYNFILINFLFVCFMQQIKALQH